MAEVQVKGWGTEAAPNSRVTKDSEHLDVIAIEATFDGTAAASSFVPAVQIVSDSGDEVGTFPLAETLVAGDSATVTFAPFLGRSSPAATPTAPVWARYRGVKSIPVAPATGSLDWILVDGTALLDLTNPLIPTVLADGLYMASHSAQTTGVTAGAFYYCSLQMDPYQAGNASTIIQTVINGAQNAVNIAGHMQMLAGGFITSSIWQNQAAAQNFSHITDLVLIA